MTLTPGLFTPEGNNLEWGTGFSEKHMAAVKRAIGTLPAEYFMDVQIAGKEEDLKQATDLVVVSVPEIGSLGVRVRSSSYYINHRTGEPHGSWDLSIRVQTRHYHWAIPAKPDGGTEIHKLRRGFCSRYFYGYSHDDKGELAAWWLLDVDKMREKGMFEWEQYTHQSGKCPNGATWCENKLCAACTPNWLQIHPNCDHTAAAYLKLQYLEEQGCVMHQWHRSQDTEAPLSVDGTTPAERFNAVVGGW